MTFFVYTVYIHDITYTYIHTYIHTYTVYIHTYIYSIHTYTHTYIHSGGQVGRHARALHGSNVHSIQALLQQTRVKCIARVQF